MRSATAVAQGTRLDAHFGLPATISPLLHRSVVVDSIYELIP